MEIEAKAYSGALAAIMMVLIGCGGGSKETSVPTVHNEWTWMGGADVVDELGTYGTEGVASSTNMPGARLWPNYWRDTAGNFWLFGGYGAPSSVGAPRTGYEGDLNDLWKYSDGKWTWVSGSSHTEQAGVYGTLGIAAPANVPGARDQAAGWIDPSGSLWLFGGKGFDSTGTASNLDDLWKYSNGEWTWVGGSSVGAQSGIVGAFQGAGIYGTQGVAAPINFPGARVGASTWTDSAGDLWLFGGFGVDANGTSGDLNDLWKYSDGEWTWMKGSNIADQNGAPQFGVYGTLGIPDSANTPGARYGAVSWTDTLGNLWLFGGDGVDVNGQRCQETGPPCNLSDLWKYSGGEWTWMGGSNLNNEPGVFGTKGVAGSNNVPSARDSAVAWVDAGGNYWLFGGIGIDSSSAWGELSDLWKFSGGEWTWVSGPNTADQPGSYGTLGTASSNNLPGCRIGAAGWPDKSGNLWLFGGDDSLAVAHGGKFNDLWEYKP